MMNKDKATGNSRIITEIMVADENLVTIEGLRERTE